LAIELLVNEAGNRTPLVVMLFANDLVIVPIIYPILIVSMLERSESIAML
jgi:hypothetical protein